jgi:MFS family permease
MTALPRRDFAIVFAVLLVVAMGNTALQSILPALGRALKLPDIAVALFFSLSALVWTFAAPRWARRSDHEGRKRIMLIGLSGFAVATLAGAVVVYAGQSGWLAPAVLVLALALARAVFGLFGSATMPAAQAYVASRTSRAERTTALAQLTSAFGLGTILGPALAPFFVLPGVRLAGPLFLFGALGVAALLLLKRGLPDDRGAGVGADGSKGAAAAMPSIGGAPTGASAVAAAAEVSATRLSWRDPRVRPWILFGALSANAQAAAGQTLGFLIIDRLAMEPEAAQSFIGVALMAGAGAALLAQWGLIQAFNLKPPQLVRWGAALACAGLGLLSLANDYHAIIVAFALACAGFGFTRPGFAAGASLAVARAEQGPVAGLVTAVNGGAFIVAPAIGIALYAIDPHAPFILSTLVTAGLALWAWRGDAFARLDADGGRA